MTNNTPTPMNTNMSLIHHEKLWTMCHMVCLLTVVVLLWSHKNFAPVAELRSGSNENFTPAAKLHRGSQENFLPVAMLRGGSHKN